MKRVLSFALTIAFAISLCVCTVEAFPLMDESIAPMRASDYFLIIQQLLPVELKVMLPFLSASVPQKL